MVVTELKWYFATTDSYASGAKVAFYINNNKKVYFNDDITVAGDIEGASLDINGDADVSGALLLAEFIKHTGDVNTNIQFLAGQMILKNSGGKYINLHANGNIYFDASGYQFNTGNATFAGDVTVSGGDIVFRRNW